MDYRAQRQLSLGAKLRIGFGGLLLILLALSGTSVVMLTVYSGAFERLFHENYDSVIYCSMMEDALDGLNYEAQRAIWDETPTATEAVATLEKQFADNLVRQRGNCFLPTETQMSAALAASWDAYRREYDQFASLSPQADRVSTYRKQLLPHSRQLREAADVIRGMNLKNMVDVDGQVRSLMATVRSFLIGLAVVGSTMALIFAGAVVPSMLKPLSSLTRSARQIADGQLDQSVEVRTTDEVGQLASAFNAMAERLREARARDRERLARSEQTTQRAIDSLPDAVIVLGSDGHIELTNRAATELFALAPRSDLPPPPFVAALGEEVLRRQQRFEPTGYRSAIQKFSDGEERFYLPHAVPLLGEDGRAVGVTVVLADVTRLKQADEVKSDLVSTVSHELRTPLTSIRMAVHMLEEETFGPLGPDQKELLKTARENSDRLNRILENLMGINRIESGRAPLSLEPMPAQDVVEHAVSPLLASFNDAGVTLIADTAAADGATVLADPSVVGHVLSNLLTNALRHTPRNGEVRVTCRSSDTRVAFCISDNGPGIAAEHLPHVFEKFYRVTTPTVPAGAGLGLAIAKEIVEAHGGTISAESTPGHGATFTFTLVRS
jgi:PAS domain S-box-containing protein